MHVKLVMVISLDGKITKSGKSNIHDWTSEEDQKHFASVVEHHNAIVMGSKTYAAAKSMLQHTPDRLRVIITRTPENYKDDSIPGQLEFTSASPREVLESLEERGYSDILLAGGGEINSLFFKDNLVDELWITVEPAILGKGNFLVAEEELHVKLQLKSFEKMNEKGTLLLKYFCLK